MERITRSPRGVTGGRRRLGLLVLALAAVGLAACDPPPPPDGRDLGIEAVDAPTDLAPGEQATIDATITNHGTVAADAVRLGFLEPSSIEVDGITGTDVTDCSEDGTTGGCSLGDLAPGQTRTVAVAVTARSAAPAADLVLAVTSEGTEATPDPHANSARLPITVSTGAAVDLEVEGGLVGLAAPGATIHSISTITNHANSAASGVQVTQEVPVGATVTATRFRQPLPGGGVAVGSCAVAGRLVTCTTGGALVPPATSDAHRWVLEVELTAGASTTSVLHTVSSAHPEPDPDPNPNTATALPQAGRAIVFSPEPPVAVGEVFDITGVAVMDGAIPANYVSVARPSNIEAVSVTVDGQTTPCTPTGGCTGYPFWGVGNGSNVSVRLRAVAAGPSSGVGVNLSTIGFGISGGTLVQVIDPSITSEVHPELAEPDDGVVGLGQAVRGTVRNTGATAHPSVTATFELPANLEADEARWGPADLPCDIDGTTVACAVGAVPAYGSVDLSLWVTPTAAGPAPITLRTTTTTAQDTPDPAADEATTSFDVAGSYVDLGLTPYASHDPAVEAVLWQVIPTIRNHGTIPATDTEVVATLPDGVSIGSIYVGAPVPEDSGECTREGQTVTCDVGTIPAGGSARVYILNTVTIDDAGTVEISVTSNGAEPDPDPHPNTVTQELTTVAANADLRARFVSPPSSVVTGQPVTFSHQVRNDDGPSNVPSATIAFEAPAGWTITASEWDRHGVRVPCPFTATTSTCQTESIPHRTSATVYTTVVPGAVTPAAALTTTATSPTPDPDLVDNVATHTVAVLAANTDIGVTATYGATTPVGTPNTVDLRVTNSGPAAAESTVVSTTLPASVQVDAVNTFTTGFTCDTVDQVLTCTHPYLPTGQSILRLTLRDTALGPMSFTVTATTSTPQVPDTLADAVTVTRTVTAVGGRITGTVVNPSGGPVSAMTVWFYRVGETGRVASATTDSTGTYSVAGLAAGQYQVRFLPNSPTGLEHEWFDGVRVREDATVFTTAGLGEVFTANASLVPRVPTVVRGQVVDAAGQPVAGVVVGAYLATDTFAATYRSTTAADGTYEVTILTDHPFRLRFGPPAGSGLLAEWFDDQPLRADGVVLEATAWGQVIVADAVLAAAP